MRFALLVVECLMVASCSAELSQAEQEFYGRSTQLVGHRTEEVTRQLGEPTRMVDAGRPCRDRGGNKEWVYESFDAPAGRERLKGGSVLICFSSQGIVVANFHVYE